MPRAVRLAALALVALVLAAYAARAASPYLRRPAAALAASDFLAFGCGIRVADRGGDPYRFAPLLACQRAVTPDPALEIDPAPFPPYFFAVLAPLGRMPFREAGVVWLAAIVAAVAVAAAALRRLTGLPWWVLAPPVVVLDFATNVPFAQIPPFVVALVALAALALRGGRDRLAALAIAGTAIEPHVALPLWLALAAYRPRARLVLAACGLVLVATSLAAAPAGRWHEYVALVLPTQAAAEAPFRIQYTLTYVALALGAATQLAVRAGSLDYAATVALAAAVAGPLARRLRDPAVVVTFPAAAVLLGGVYVHLGQMAIALPFVLALLARAGARNSGRVRGVATTLVVLLACGWPFPEDHVAALASLAVVATSTAFAMRDASWRRAAFGAAAACALYALVAVALGRAPGIVRPPESAAAFALRYDPALAATQDGIELRRDVAPVVIRTRDLAQKLPVWLALLGMWAVALTALRRPVQASASETSSASRGAGTTASAIPP